MTMPQCDPLKSLEPEVGDELAAIAGPPPLHAVAPSVAQWPEPPAPEAYHGLAGEIVRALGPATEADPVALLSQVLVAAGSMIGRGPCYLVEGDRHAANLYVVLVGATAKGRKGTSWGRVRSLCAQVDAAYDREHIHHGLSSGEGLVWLVRDAIEEQEPIRDHGRVTDYQTVTRDPGVTDKRLLVVEPEYASVLRVIAREGNTLSARIRDAWDDGQLRLATKNNPLRATDAHISIIGHITRDEVRRYLDRTELGNGFANRHLWLCVRRARILPDGGTPDGDLAALQLRLMQAVEHSRAVGPMHRSDDGRAVWHEIYADLSEGHPGLLGAATSRAEAQVLRLSMLYALLDLSQAIRGEHVRAAAALWEYAEASARYVFGAELGDPVADEILRALRSVAEGMSRTQISGLFARNKSAGEIDRALTMLADTGSAVSRTEQTAGRPVVRWLAVGARGHSATRD